MDPAEQGEGAAHAAVLRPAAYAVRNMMDMPEALITILLENMFSSDELTHGERAALQCVNKCLYRLCTALSSFHLLKPSGCDLFALLQRVTSSKLIDGIKLQGLSIDVWKWGPEGPPDAQQPLCMALGALAVAPAASGIRALHINTCTGRLDGTALGSLWGLRSLQALKIHTLCPSEHSSDLLYSTLNHLTGLTCLDINMQPPDVPYYYEDAAARWAGNCDYIPMVDGFPSSLIHCTRLRRLSLCWPKLDTTVPSDVPEEFGNLTSLETVSLICCEIMSLPDTITRLTRLESLTIENSGCYWNCWDEDCDWDGNVWLPEGFDGAMPNLRAVKISQLGDSNKPAVCDAQQAVS